MLILLKYDVIFEKIQIYFQNFFAVFGNFCDQNFSEKIFSTPDKTFFVVRNFSG